MFIQTRNNHSKNNPDRVSQALKLAGATGLIVASVENLSQIVHKKASNITPKDYLVAGILSAGMIGMGYGISNIFVPMWREVTEYRPNESPFIRSSSYLDLHHEHLNDDIYS